MKRFFNTPNFLFLGIVVAAAGLLYLGIIWHCPQKNMRVAETNEFATTVSIPA